MHTRRTPVGLLAVGMAILVASLGTLTGCDEGQAGDVLGAALGEDARLAADAVEVPTMDALRTALTLTDEQVTALTPALDAWRETVAERHAMREARRASRPRGPRGTGEAGPRGGDRTRARLHQDEGRPVMTFLAESGGILETDQMVTLAGLLAERCETNRVANRAGRGRGAGRGPGAGVCDGNGPHGPRAGNCDGSGPHGPRGMGAGSGPNGPGDGTCDGTGPHGPRAGFGPGHGAGAGMGGGAFMGGAMRVIVHELGVETETVDALREVIHEQHDATRTLWKGYRDGSVSAEALRDGIGDARRAIEATLESHLDADQLATLESHVSDARERMAERQLERLNARIERHTAFLVKALDLDEAHAATVTGIIQGTKPRATETITAAAQGTIELEEAIYRTLTLRAETAEAIRGALTEDRARVFDALRELMPRG